MLLKTYQAKRDLKNSHEPSASISSKKSTSLRFCVQKHAARSLHFDFRLECHGILLSWAVPKGLSLNPHDKRLAIKVEDHPLQYQYFEGIIPKGHYGAGTVEIWDHGTYTVSEGDTLFEMEKKLEKGLKQGHFAITVKGEKLKGEFVFQKLKQSPQDNAWLIIKRADAYALEETHHHANPEKAVSSKKAKPIMPEFVSPMLATLIDHSFDSDDWLFEIKWDGYRGLAFIDNGNVQLKSRNKILLNQNFPTIIQQLKKIPGQAILDGELVVIDSQGKSHFQLMQNYQRERKGHLCYYVFDLLYKDGQNLSQLPLIERKEILKKYLDQLNLPLIRFSGHVLREGEAFFKEAAKKGLEGIIGKKIASTYQSRRSKDWVKIKTILQQEVVIGGFTAPRGSRKKFGALLVGIYDDQKQLQYSGHVGGGFDEALLDEVYDKLKPLIQKKSAFEVTPKANAPVTWVKPKLICEVSFSEWTKDNMMRHPVFHGLRVDKKPQSVKKEVPDQLPSDLKNKNARLTNNEKLVFTNSEKIYWSEENYTKGDLIEYYRTIAPFILPHLKDRPIMLHRYPDGIKGKDFYQKDLSFSHPNWIKTYPIQHAGKTNHYLRINDLASLLYAINLGSIDLHPFMSRYKNLENPDYCVIDLDPHGVPFERTVEVALAMHEILESIEIAHFCKTSGGKGLHIVIPLHSKYDYEQSKQFATIIALCVHKKFPALTSLERNPEKRPKKIYLDCLQNRFGQTLAAPYSVRPRPHACVSTPLLWEEITKKLDPSHYNMKTIPKRLETLGDIFQAVLKLTINMKTALTKMKKILEN